MPIYEYQCTQCERVFEKLQKVNDPPVETCEECGGTVRRRISPPAIQFKGSGWYVTDYAGKGKKPASESGDGKGGGSDASNSKKSSSEPSGSKAGGD